MTTSLDLARAVDAALEATIIGSFTKIGPAVRRRTDAWEPTSSFDLSGKTMLVTGANSGLGLAAATALARTGATVRVTVRSDAKGTATVDQIVEASGNQDVSYDVLDLTDLDAVRAFTARWRDADHPLDGLLHNAGAMFAERSEVDGIETTTLLHVVAPMVLTEGLMPALRASTHPGRVVFVTSGGMYAEGLRVHRLQSPKGYTPATAYARAKRAQVVLTDQLAQRLGTDIAVHAMHPGWAATPGVQDSLPIFNTLMGPLLRTPDAGADTAVWLMASPETGRDPGKLWLDRRPRSTVRVPKTGHGPDEAAALWAEIVRLGQLDEGAFAPHA
ncbi:MAG: dehydrogenase/reductase SDR family protein 12 [Nitriliruptoraceae bacterium]|jgi:dehydrogenase/reductase SDR family protein 12